MKTFQHRALWTALFATAIGLASVVNAETVKRDITDLQLRLQSGQVEKVSFDTLAVGEQRNVTSELGNLVIVSRNETGLKAETGGEIFEATMGQDALETAIEVIEGEDLDGAEWTSANGEHKKIIVHVDDNKSETDGKKEHKKVVMIKRHGDEQLSEAELQAMIEKHTAGDVVANELPEGKRIMLMRRVEVRDTQTQAASGS